MKLGLGLLGALALALFTTLIGVSTTHNNEVEDLQAQIEDLENDLEAQQDYIEEIHRFVNDYTYNDSGTVFVYIDEDGDYHD